MVTAANPKKPPELPEFLSQSPILAKTRVKRNGLAKYQEQIHQAYAPALLPLYYRKLYELLSKGDREALRIMGDIYGLVQAKGGINVTNQLFNANMNGQAPVTMDSIVRRICEKPPEVIDAEPTDGPLAA